MLAGLFVVFACSNTAIRNVESNAVQARLKQVESEDTPMLIGACDVIAKSGIIACDVPSERVIIFAKNGYRDQGQISYQSIGSIIDSLKISPSGDRLIISFADYRSHNNAALLVLELDTGAFEWLVRSAGGAGSFEFLSDNYLLFFRYGETLSSWQRCKKLMSCQHTSKHEARLVGSLTILDFTNLVEYSALTGTLDQLTFIDNPKLVEDVIWFGPGKIYKNGKSEILVKSFRGLAMPGDSRQEVPLKSDSSLYQISFDHSFVQGRENLAKINLITLPEGQKFLKTDPILGGILTRDSNGKISAQGQISDWFSLAEEFAVENQFGSNRLRIWKQAGLHVAIYGNGEKLKIVFNDPSQTESQISVVDLRLSEFGRNNTALN